MKKTPILILILLAGVAFAQQYPDLTLDKILTKEEMESIGISKLSDLEKERLRILIIEKYVSGFENGKAEGLKQKGASTSEIIESQIDGEYEGWQGETIVKLMNGQIWQQSEYFYHYHYSFMPKIMIYKSASGYKMKVDGVEKAVSVTRLK
jgi:hypothetical protein